MTTSTSVERRRRLARRALLSLSTILCSGLSAPVLAQLAGPAPVHQSIDANGVDLFAGTMNVDAPGVSMGQGAPQGLSYNLLNRGNGWADNLTASLNQIGNMVTVSLGGVSDSFTIPANTSGVTYVTTRSNGATLAQSNGGIFTYTDPNGTIVHFDPGMSNGAPFYASAGRATDRISPDQSRLVYSYDSISYCTASKQLNEEQVCTSHSIAYRLASIVSSYGYKLTLSYGELDPYDEDDKNQTPNMTEFATVIGSSLSNSQNGSAGSRSFSASYSGSGTILTVTDLLNRSTVYRMSGLGVAGITLPGSNSEDVSVGYMNGRVSSVTREGVNYSYTSADNSGVRTVAVTDAQNHTTTYTFDIAKQVMTSMTDAQGHKTQWTPDAYGRITLMTAPEGNSSQYTYDVKGNVTRTVLHAKPGSGAADIATSATYPCRTTLTCNKPETVTDARGNVTTYSYDPTHGGVTSVTAPAPSSGAVHPQVRISYTQFADVFGNQSSVWLPTGTSTCRTQANCAGSPDEVVSSTDYGSLSGNNLLPLSMKKGAGDGSLTATMAMSYDPIGNMATSTDPLGNVTAYRYDDDREVTGVVGPDPDGSGTGNWNPAERFTYNGRGQVTLTEQGTAPGQSDTDWNSFSSHHQVATAYDPATGRKTQDTAQSSGATSSLVQYSYDGLGRIDCVTTRMNPDTYGGSLPSACDLGPQGSSGPDRISRYEYDELDRFNKAWSGYRTNDAASSLTGYTLNGQTQSVTDENGNTTTFEYDGLDRLFRTRYPNASGGGSSTSDYEQTEYDPVGNLTRRWLRGTGNHQDYSYDALSRVINLAVPGLGTSDHPIRYGYDNLGELTSANDDNNMFVVAGYDALGRKVSEGSRFGGTKTFGYDLASRRTSIVWQDGFYVTYAYDNVGHMTAAYDNTANALFHLSYDDDGRRTTLCPNSTMGLTAICSQYGYDGVGRLNTANLTGANGTSMTFGYNPAGQIGQRQNSNDGYAWKGSANGSTGYAVNGLNQYTSVAGAGVGYDPHGNLTSLNGNTYSYDSFNRLGEYNGGYNAGNWLYYDAVGRLNWSNASQTRFDYDDSQLISELDANNNIVRRYVYGPNPDEPAVWYEGSDTSDKRFLQTDERGSVIRVSRADGSTLAVDSYDEYGDPASGNQGRFGFTGQTWLPELKLWNYKARMYAPGLGRFMQTDPVGYGDGLNDYAYVQADPVNNTDPLGLQGCAAGDAFCLSASTTVGGPPGASSGSSGNPFFAAIGLISNLFSGLFGNHKTSTLAPPPAPTPVRAPQRTQTPTPCQQAFLKSQLASRGLPTSQIANLRFVSGLNGSANFFTRQAFNGGAIAVTQGTTVFVQPGSFSEVANFRSPIPFEEAYHTAQFASDGAFYSTYGILSVGGLLSMFDSYKGNAYEAFAQGASRQMFAASKAGMCPAGQ